MLKGGQKKLDANKDGKISGEDFKLLRSKKGMKEGGPADMKGNASERDVELFQKVMRIKALESKNISDKNMKFVKDNMSKLKGVISDRELESLQKMMDMANKPGMKKGGDIGRPLVGAMGLKESIKSIFKKSDKKPEKKSKGGSIFSRQNYKRTGKI